LVGSFKHFTTSYPFNPSRSALCLTHSTHSSLLCIVLHAFFALLSLGNVLVNTAIGRTKQRNLSRDNRIAISVADQNNPYDMVTIRGTMKNQITGREAEEHIDKLAKKYLGKDKYPYRSP
jgi:CBS domain containing-hemolysin-like protein